MGKRGIEVVCLSLALVAVFLLAACGVKEQVVQEARWSDAKDKRVSNLPAGAAKIEHVVIITQENHSFDNYFGTFPGANGIPMKDGTPTPCIPDPDSKRCERPFYNSSAENYGGPHDESGAKVAIDGGKMDGFLQMERAGRNKSCGTDKQPNPDCSPAGEKGAEPDVMGYRDRRTIPNYWRYAEEYVLQDRFFASMAAASVPNNLARVSGWSATCSSSDPMSCRNDLDPYGGYAAVPVPRSDLAWTDITDLLHENDVSWAYYVETGPNGTPPSRNPLPYFTTVKENGQLGNIQDVARFHENAKNGRLPAVSWVMSGPKNSEHPPASIQDGQAFVTRAVNSVMQVRNWENTVIFLTWDEWGGFYDHVPPEKVDENGYGIRVPGLVISPYAKRGYIDSQTLTSDAYLKFIEDRFLDSQRLDPATMSRPDPRPSVRENAPQLGDITQAFDFNQKPRPPLVLPERPSSR